MHDTRAKLSIALAALTLLTLLATYTCAYFTNCIIGDPNYGMVRMYSSRWHILAFVPAARIESLVRGAKVTVLTYHSGGDDTGGR